jgi:hypothetical protein
MVDAWLNLPIPAMLTALTLAYGVSAVLLHLLSFRLGSAAWVRSLGGIVAPFFSSVAVLFSLLTGFLGNDVWTRNREALRAVVIEGDTISTLNTLSIASASDMRSIRDALRAYAQSVVADEWPTMADEESSPKTEAAMTEILREISKPDIAQHAGPAVHSALLTTVLRLRGARDDRLALAADRSNGIKWLSILILCLITQIAIALVHLERPRAQLTALLVFSVASVVSLGLIAVHELPFEGAVRITPAPIEAALKALAPATDISAAPR